jgi:hypothetical protein
MLMSIVSVLFILWMLGILSGYTLGGAIHIMLVVAIVVVLNNVIQSRRNV